ncbi:dirigent protein 22-like [Rhododendron vialii]|uniref:dirigent protein 22-like n=1 Tax=Rhododendron vialii TaxID=182163 RepID=UPI00265F5D32|nr:dirigent protein 22-like [Rhododendron vialii]
MRGKEMAALTTIVYLCLIVGATAMPAMDCIDESPEGVAKWFQNLGHRKEKLTTFKLYLHDQVSGKNPTAVVVARANFTSKTPAPTPFGTIVVIDDPLTVGSELNSTVMARAQGIYLSDGLEEFALNMNFNFVFTSGKYKGSTLSLFGRNPVFHPYRKLSIVGGTGVFRLARGIVTVKTYQFNATSNDASLQYYFDVLHY